MIKENIKINGKAPTLTCHIQEFLKLKW